MSLVALLKHKQHVKPMSSGVCIGSDFIGLNPVFRIELIGGPEVNNPTTDYYLSFRPTLRDWRLHVMHEDREVKVSLGISSIRYDFRQIRLRWKEQRRRKRLVQVLARLLKAPRPMMENIVRDVLGKRSLTFFEILDGHDHPHHVR